MSLWFYSQMNHPDINYYDNISGIVNRYLIYRNYTLKFMVGRFFFANIFKREEKKQIKIDR